MCKIDSQSVQPFDHNLPVFWIVVDPIKPPTMRPGVSWGELLEPMSIPRWIHRRVPNLCQSVQPFDSFPKLLNVWPPNTTPRHAPWGIEEWLVFSLCPFPDESTDVCQSWRQSVQPFDSFPWLLKVWPPKTPQVPPCVSHGNLFGVYPFPDESAHVYQSSCQSDQPFDIFPWLLNLWPPNPPMSRGELYLAYVHSQTNPQTCTKFGANRSSRLTASQDFWICDPLNPPEIPPVSWGLIGLAYIHSQMNLHMCAKFGVNRSSRLVNKKLNKTNKSFRKHPL